MITISDKEMEILNSLENGQHFLYYDFPAFKIDGGAVLLNCENKFIIAKQYPNCLTLGAGFVKEFNTAKEAIENAPEIMKHI